MLNSVCQTFCKDISFALLSKETSVAKSKIVKKIGSTEKLDIMLDADIDEGLPTLQVYENRKLGRKKLLHQTELTDIDSLEDNKPKDLEFSFLSLKILGSIMIMASGSSVSEEFKDSSEDDQAESFEMVKRKGLYMIEQRSRFSQK